MKWTIDMLRVSREGLEALLRMLRYLATDCGWSVSRLEVGRVGEDWSLPNLWDGHSESN